MDELALLADADRRAHAYLAATNERRAFSRRGRLGRPDGVRRAAARYGPPADDVLRLLDERGTPATVASNGPNYFGFVIGATLPRRRAERLMLAWDQCASSYANSPVAATIERQYRALGRRRARIARRQRGRVRHERDGLHARRAGGRGALLARRAGTSMRMA